MPTNQSSSILQGKRLLPSSSLHPPPNPSPLPLLYSPTPLSFWGGISPLTSQIIDHTSPLHNRSTSSTALALPSSRGSCTGSQVLLELIANGNCPDAILTRDVLDEVLVAGVLVAEELFSNQRRLPTLISLNEFETLKGSEYISIVAGEGDNVFLCHGNTAEEVSDLVSSLPRPSRVTAPPHIPPCILPNPTPAQELAWRILYRLALLSSPNDENEKEPTFIPITRAHIDACTYIGPSGLSFIETLLELDGTVSVPTTLNSISVDLLQSSKFHPTISIPSQQLASCYTRLGAQPTFTCAPYLRLDPPQQGEVIAWGESNAVVFANSCLGAMTEKYPDFVDVCAALVGFVPRKGMYLDSNRMWNVVIDVTDCRENCWQLIHDDNEEEEEMDDFFPLLGYAIGKLARDRIPLIVGLEDVPAEMDDWKAFSAAFGTSGSAPMFHVRGVTPEATNVGDVVDVDEEMTMDRLREAFWDLNNAAASSNDDNDPQTTRLEDNIDLVAFGNPHLSLSECRTLSALCDGTVKHPNVSVVATLSREVHSQAFRLGYISTLQTFGMEFIHDTCWCMITEPIVPTGGTGTSIMTNSGKYAHYAPGLVGRSIRFGSMRLCMDAARKGTLKRVEPKWLLGGLRKMSSMVFKRRGLWNGVCCILSRGKVR